MDKIQQEYRVKFPDIGKKYLELRTSSRRFCVNFPKGFHKFPQPRKK